MKKRRIEVFTAGCSVCDEAVKLIEGFVCSDCEVRVLDLRKDMEAQTKARQYGVKRVPAVAVEGKLAECCQGGISVDALCNLGVGVKL